MVESPSLERWNKLDTGSAPRRRRQSMALRDRVASAVRSSGGHLRWEGAAQIHWIDDYGEKTCDRADLLGTAGPPRSRLG